MANSMAEETALQNSEVRGRILAFEKVLSKTKGAVFGDDACPLRHHFAEGCYIREMFKPAGMLSVSKIHKVSHPYFLLLGEVSVITEEGATRIKAPYWGITLAGTKRVTFSHEDTLLVTVHVTKETDLDKIEEEIIASDYEELALGIKESRELIDRKEHAL